MSNRKLKMTDVSSGRREKRNLAANGLSDSSKVILLNSSVLLLEVPAGTETDLPVWDAMRSMEVGITWMVKPYSITVNLTPLTAAREEIAAACQTESPSSAAEASTSCCSTLQPQIQNTASLYLTVTQNSQPLFALTHQPRLNLVNPIPVSLPLFIATTPQGRQSGTILTKNLQSALQAPASVSDDLGPQTKLPRLSQFHTKNSADVLVCDNFLLGACDAGVQCKMHHTPYPFHWQLRSVKTHQWVDLSARAQVLLERNYCWADRGFVTLSDGRTCFTLNFDYMELDYLTEYNGVRRLTNSEGPERNPHFPSEWKIYWDDDVEFQEYRADLSDLLLRKMSEKKPECYFRIGALRYVVDFITMTQTSMRTGFRRDVCCRPAYRSPELMHPQLRTVIPSDSTHPDNDATESNFSVDPLREFTSWYPPVWHQATEEDYRLVDVQTRTRAYQSIKRFFSEYLPETKTDIVSIQQVQNLLHWDKYQRQKTHMQKRHAKTQGPLERHLFHGTYKEASDGICRNNFDPRVAGLHGHSLGFGCYFATDASMSHSFTDAEEFEQVGYMFLAKVLVGRVCLGKPHYHRPPDTRTVTYDSCVDNKRSPQRFVVFDSCQCYPYYLLRYKQLSAEINIKE